MNKYIKQILILVIIFIIILWVQNNDDRKKNKTRKNYYDKIKLPLLATAIVGLFLNVDVDKLNINTQRYINQGYIDPNINPNASINKIPTHIGGYNYYNNQQIFTSEFDANF